MNWIRFTHPDGNPVMLHVPTGTLVDVPPPYTGHRGARISRPREVYVRESVESVMAAIDEAQHDGQRDP